MDFATYIGIFGFVALVLLIIIGIPVFLSMLLVAMIGFWLLGGIDFMLIQMTNAPFNIAESYMFAVVPLFILMGELAAQTGLASSSYYALAKWVGKLRGGLLMATIGANAIFGAVSSMPIAVTTLSVKVALPELLKAKYDKTLCLAAIATAGVLDSLIPPSTAILIFCIITNLSVGRALVAGIIPGIVLTFIFFLTVWIYAKIYPDKIPAMDIQVTWRERFSSLTNLWPVLLLFMVIIGGIYLGIFPPTVGGAIGAMTVLIYAFARRIDKKIIYNSFKDMVAINCQLFPMVIAGFIFSRFTALTGLTEYLVNFVTRLDAPPLLVMLVVIILYVLISFPMDLMPVLIITLPVFFPLLTGIGFDPFLIVIVMVLMGVLADLTPPIGMSVYIVASLANVDIMQIYRGVVPWFIITFIFVWIIILFPPLTTWLPNLMFAK